jgi:peroxiredoxin/DNA-binding transcriptional MerR regulator
MQATTAAMRAGVSIKALRYYEQQRLIHPTRLPNGYRAYSELDVEIARQIASLIAIGFTVQGTRPFVECLRRGHEAGDTCVESLVAYRDEIKRLDAAIVTLRTKRDHLQQKLTRAAAHGFEAAVAADRSTMSMDYTRLPPNLPVPRDDGSADHLTGMDLPDLELRAHDGSSVRLRGVSPKRWVLFVYPATGIPGEDMPLGWDSIPGARGCTPEACGFRDLIGELYQAGARAVYGLSGQGSNYQAELAGRLHLPYLLLSDAHRELGGALKLPTFQAGSGTYYQRLTLIVNDNRIEHVFFPIFPPDQHAAQVLEWLKAHPIHE